MGWWRGLLIGALVGVMVCGVAAAQAEPVRIVQGSDGSLYLLKDGARYSIAVDAIDDDELSAYADGGTLSATELVAALGGSPEPAASAATNAVPSTAQVPAAGDDSGPAAGDDATVAAPANSAAAKVSASGAAHGPATAQQPARPALTRPGVPSLTFVKVQGAAPGGTATVTVQSTPAASCTLAYRTPTGNPSSAVGPGQQTADANGLVSWSWPIDGNTKTGLGSISVNCGNLSINDTIQIGSGGGGTR